jgi:trehalose-phosphatase
MDKAELAEWARAAEHLWLFLDYDGTLAKFAPTPAGVQPSPRVVDLLSRLSHKPAVRLTIISGRRLPDVRQLVPVKGIFLAGSYGVELLTPGGELVSRAQYGAVRPPLDAIKPRWQRLIDGGDGFFLEDKGWTLALHARLAESGLADQVLAEARSIAAGALPAAGFKLVGGYKFLEIAPLAANKREAVQYLLDRYPLPDAKLLYIGDDEKDEEAFTAIHSRGGRAVKVREASTAGLPTAADLYFDSPRVTLEWLQLLL